MNQEEKNKASEESLNKLREENPNDFITIDHIQRYIDVLAEAIIDKLSNLDDQIEEVADQLEAKIDEKIEKKLKDRNVR